MTDKLYPLTKARAAMLLMQPFFGALALRLTLKEMPDDMIAEFKARRQLPTMATDGVNIFFDTAFVASLNGSELQTVLAHEVGHCMFDHLGRRESRDPQRWNMAADHVVNLVLKDAGFSAVGNWLCDPKYAGMTAEQVYAALQDGTEDQPDPMCNIMKPGSGTDGDPDEASASIQATEWSIAVAQAAQAAKMAGKLPASLERLVGDMLKPKVNWRDVLRDFITCRARDEYTWTRPNRMYLSMGFYAPGLYSEQMDALAVVIDTSGSIDERTLSAFAGEISGIRDSTAPKSTRVIYCDARVNHVDEFERHDELTTKMHGGGGTDFRPPFAHLERAGVEPTCLVYLTDGWGPYPDAPPNYPVLWCMTTDVKPPWGDVVRIEI